MYIVGEYLNNTYHKNYGKGTGKFLRFRYMKV